MGTLWVIADTIWIGTLPRQGPSRSRREGRGTLSLSSREAVLENHSATSPQLALGCGPSGPPSSGSSSWSPGGPFCFSPLLPPSPPCQRGLFPYWICPCSPVLTHPSRDLTGQNCRLAPAPALGLAVRVQAGPRSIGLLRRCDCGGHKPGLLSRSRSHRVY